MEGDSVTLNTGVQTNQQDRIKWYYNDTRIAQINRDQSKICTDVQCNNDTERFRDRLKLDHQTGSLTITDTTNTDSGVYKLKIISSSTYSDKIFSVSVTGVSAAEREVKRKEGESVTLYTGVIKNTNYFIMWDFNNTLIAEINGDQSKICTDVQCDERLRDRLKLDHQTGSLIIMNTRNTDSGEYKLQISNRRFSIIRIFSVSVTDSGYSSAVIAGISAAVVLLFVTVAVAAVIYYCIRKNVDKTSGNEDQEIGDTHSIKSVTNETSLHKPENPQMDAAKWMCDEAFWVQNQPLPTAVPEGASNDQNEPLMDDHDEETSGKNKPLSPTVHNEETSGQNKPMSPTVHNEETSGQTNELLLPAVYGQVIASVLQALFAESYAQKH